MYSACLVNRLACLCFGEGLDRLVWWRLAAGSAGRTSNLQRVPLSRIIHRRGHALCENAMCAESVTTTQTGLKCSTLIICKNTNRHEIKKKFIYFLQRLSPMVAMNCNLRGSSFDISRWQRDSFLLGSGVFWFLTTTWCAEVFQDLLPRQHNMICTSSGWKNRGNIKNSSVRWIESWLHRWNTRLFTKAELQGEECLHWKG